MRAVLSFKTAEQTAEPKAQTGSGAGGIADGTDAWLLCPDTHHQNNRKLF